MPRLDVRRIAAVLLLLFLALAPALSWAGVRRAGATTPREGASLLGRSLLSAFWGLFKSVWEEEGGSLDPSGLPRPNSGGSLDPDGSPTPDSGSDLDPNG